ncbi:cytochrome P450 [Saccharothrix sp. HUAS TT1]|uniref:cytochrome P450 family protein n=1 Tax=unclassified Saccharothrix TaxID=2593673 RepID=UPI00345BB59A
MTPSDVELFTGTYRNHAQAAHAAMLADGARPRRAYLPGLAPAWLVVGDTDARAALLDPRLSKESVLVRDTIADLARAAGLPVPADLSRMFGDSALFRDGERHAAQRRLLTGAFTAKRIRDLRPRMERIALGLLDELPGRADGGVVDVVEHLAAPLPLIVICELLGIPEVDRDRFRRLTVLLMNDDPAVNVPASDEMASFFADLIAAKRAAARHGRDGGDLTTALLDADDTQLIDILFLVFVAGHETTVNLLGNAMLALLTHPPLWTSVAEHPELAARAVEETLRWDCPVRTATHRVTLEPVVYGGVTIPAGELVMVSLDSANRDPRRWDQPDRFDLGRDTRGHLAFGHGPHTCLGAPLGRAEGEIVLRLVTRRFPHAEPGVPVRPGTAAARWVNRTESTIMNGLEALPVRLAAGPLAA